MKISFNLREISIFQVRNMEKLNLRVFIVMIFDLLAVVYILDGNQ